MPIIACITYFESELSFGFHMCPCSVFFPIYLLDLGLSFHPKAQGSIYNMTSPPFFNRAFMTGDELNLGLHIPVQYFNYIDQNYHKNVDSICLALI